jgi:ferrous iron transport protein B
MVLAVNMMDAARQRGIEVDLGVLERELGVPVVPTIAVRRHGARELVAMLDRMAGAERPPVPVKETLADAEALHGETRRLLSLAVTMPRTHRGDRRRTRSLAAASGVRTARARRRDVPDLPGGVRLGHAGDGPDRRRDRIARRMDPHDPAGRAAQQPARRRHHFGVGGVIVFLPQILVLFAFILALEESGYLPRAAFLLDRMMASAGCRDVRSFRCSRASRARSPASWRRARSRIRAIASPRSSWRR